MANEASTQPPSLDNNDDALSEDNYQEADWDDLLGTGTILKRLINHGYQEETDLEAPRKYFALIDIETRYNNHIVEQESHENFLINVDADLFGGPHIVIPLMNINEESEYIFDSKFCFGEEGHGPSVPPNAKLECKITLKLRSPYDEFLAELNANERLQLAKRKKERGKFWFSRGNYTNAISIYQSLTDLCTDSEE